MFIVVLFLTLKKNKLEPFQRVFSFVSTYLKMLRNVKLIVKIKTGIPANKAPLGLWYVH